MTPLGIEILMHYCTRGVDFERMDAPACRDTIANFVKLGLLSKEAPCDRLPIYFATDGARLYLETLCKVPLPVRKWVIEQEGNAA